MPLKITDGRVINQCVNLYKGGFKRQAIAEIMNLTKEQVNLILYDPDASKRQQKKLSKETPITSYLNPDREDLVEAALEALRAGHTHEQVIAVFGELPELEEKKQQESLENEK